MGVKESSKRQNVKKKPCCFRIITPRQGRITCLFFRPEETMKAVSPRPVICGIICPMDDGLVAWIAQGCDLTKETR